MTPDVVSPELRAMMRRLKLGRLLDTLPERLVFARQQQLAHQDSSCSSSATKSPAATASPSRCAPSRPSSIPR